MSVKVYLLRTKQAQASLGYLLSLAEEIHHDIGLLGQQEQSEIPSLGVSAHIELKDEAERNRFRQDVQQMFQTLARKYGKQDGVPQPGTIFKLALACYPNQPEANSNPGGSHDKPRKGRRTDRSGRSR